MTLKNLTLYFFFIFLNVSCSHLFYHPDQHLYNTPEQFKINFDQLKFNSADGVELVAWHLKSKGKPKGLIMLFHGNAENISSHFKGMIWAVEAGYDLYIFDYRGYGLSKGKPSQDDIQVDAQSALKHAHNIAHQRRVNNFVIHGQSLGGIIATQLLTNKMNQENVDLLILESTFSSYQDLAFDKLKSYWMTFLLSPLAYVLVSDTNAPEKNLKKIKIPTIVIHSKEDRVVPYEFGEVLYNSLDTKKWFWSLESGKHLEAFFVNHKKLQNKLLKQLKVL